MVNKGFPISASKTVAQCSKWSSAVQRGTNTSGVYCRSGGHQSSFLQGLFLKICDLSGQTSASQWYMRLFLLQCRMSHNLAFSFVKFSWADFMNSHWLLTITFLSLMYLEMFSRISCFITFPNVKMRLTSLSSSFHFWRYLPVLTQKYSVLEL